MSKGFILDACAVIALLRKEQGAEIVRDLYLKADSGGIALKMNKLNFLEVYYGFLREYGEEKTEILLKNIENSPIQIVSEISDDVFREAGRLKASYRISLADSIALAQASVDDCSIVTCDHHEFDIIENSESIKFLWIR